MIQNWNPNDFVINISAMISVCRQSTFLWIPNPQNKRLTDTAKTRSQVQCDCDSSLVIFTRLTGGYVSSYGNVFHCDLFTLISWTDSNDWDGIRFVFPLKPYTNKKYVFFYNRATFWLIINRHIYHNTLSTRKHVFHFNITNSLFALYENQ